MRQGEQGSVNHAGIEPNAVTLFHIWFTWQKARRGNFLLARDNPQEPSMTKLALRFVSDDSGATAIEYGLIVAGISVAIIAVVNGLGTQLSSTFNSIATQLGGGSS
jgi:pilus assembly protein Flp/PilA